MKIYKNFEDFKFQEDIPESVNGVSVIRPASFWAEFTWNTRQVEIDYMKRTMLQLKDENYELKKSHEQLAEWYCTVLKKIRHLELDLSIAAKKGMQNDS